MDEWSAFEFDKDGAPLAVPFDAVQERRHVHFRICDPPITIYSELPPSHMRDLSTVHVFQPEAPLNVYLWPTDATVWYQGSAEELGEALRRTVAEFAIREAQRDSHVDARATYRVRGSTAVQRPSTAAPTSRECLNDGLCSDVEASEDLDEPEADEDSLSSDDDQCSAVDVDEEGMFLMDGAEDDVDGATTSNPPVLEGMAVASSSSFSKGSRPS
jgi:hypothetical protein